jgi:hypothetical protein
VYNCLPCLFTDKTNERGNSVCAAFLQQVKCERVVQVNFQEKIEFNSKYFVERVIFVETEIFEF